MRLRRNKRQFCCDYAASPKQTSTYVNFVVVACLQMTGGWWGGMMTELFSFLGIHIPEHMCLGQTIHVACSDQDPNSVGRFWGSSSVQSARMRSRDHSPLRLLGPPWVFQALGQELELSAASQYSMKEFLCRYSIQQLLPSGQWISARCLRSRHTWQIVTLHHMGTILGMMLLAAPRCSKARSWQISSGAALGGCPAPLPCAFRCPPSRRRRGCPSVRQVPVFSHYYHYCMNMCELVIYIYRYKQWYIYIYWYISIYSYIYIYS